MAVGKAELREETSELLVRVFNRRAKTVKLRVLLVSRLVAD